MAHLVPEKPDFNREGGHAEEILVKALVGGLSDDFFVFHRGDWLAR